MTKITIDAAAKRALHAWDTTTHNKSADGMLAEDMEGLRDAIEQASTEPYDQQALELCDVCGWKTIIPGEGCLNCERKAQPEKPLPHWYTLSSEGLICQCADEADAIAVAQEADAEYPRGAPRMAVRLCVVEHGIKEQP